MILRKKIAFSCALLSFSQSANALKIPYLNPRRFSPLWFAKKALEAIPEDMITGIILFEISRMIYAYVMSEIFNPQNIKLVHLRGLVYAKRNLPEDLQRKLLNAINEAHFSKSSEAIGDATTLVAVALNFPWGKIISPQTNLNRIESMLNASTFGLKDAKEAILDIIFAYNSGMTTKIPPLCLVGPPGVGKTSFALSVATALNLPMITVSAAGMSDPDTFFRGFSRTYRGSKPGFFVKKFSECGCLNPVIVIDEIDKAATGNEKGTAQNILLQIFDPAQNKFFHDLFLDIGIDISQAIFITTANCEDHIIDPLKDRMLMIQIPNYSDKEREIMANTIIWRGIPGNHRIPASLRKKLIHTALEETKQTKSIRDLKKKLSQSVIRWLRKH